MISLDELYAIVPAAGVGLRMRQTKPKQYLPLAQSSVIEEALRPLLDHRDIRYIVVAIHPNDSDFRRLAIAANPRIRITVGGAQRAESVLAGLQTINDGWVLVHDAVRPCLHQDDLNRLLEAREAHAAGAILATPVCDSIKWGDAQGKIVGSLPRQSLWQALTPQLFPALLLRDCLQRALEAGVAVTDEASALTYCGYSPNLVAGRADNIKITYPADLALANHYLAQRTGEKN